ncbi:hypothetical protein HYPSUDRAFT_130038 [Hypholoma sublateritium FD-334 SS-4]|uniref:Rpr2-domain-containing protein n=1 Tax=Hypholoma sublateritium (strain FD-334 SS-4) TaxID=945553 RepID=A0A0D2Q8P9_HYPSF|nr:hypothetical protein HYPSUDRAFT_130038 [Hypholoma sublateritium FD-334 SS-4]
MAKKQNEATPNVNATANRDVVQRLNFLYQASVYLQSIAPPAPSHTPADNGKGKATQASVPHEAQGTSKLMSRKQRKTQRRVVGTKKTTGDLGRSYVQCMRAVGQKSTVKMDPSLKRSLCSNCNTTLITGTSASVRVKPSRAHGNIMIYTCLHCKATKRIPAPPNVTTRHPTPPPLVPAELPSVLQESVPPDIPPVDEQSRNADAQHRRQRKREKVARHLPLFARRDAGHVVFRGNERIAQDDEGGMGIAFA